MKSLYKVCVAQLKEEREQANEAKERERERENSGKKNGQRILEKRRYR